MGNRLKTSFRAELQPLTEQHFGEKLESDQPTGNIFYVYGFGAVAIFMLLIACINYVNLATARAAKQAKEVGMRKVLGASQTQLVSQFLGESLTFTAIALVLALILMELALAFTPIGRLMGKEHLLAALREPSVWLGVVAVTVFVAIASGLYPALYLSNITPLAALTETRKSWKKGFSLRQILVFAQLAISIGVVASTMLMANQMRYIHDLPLGFDKENRLILNNLTGLDVLKNLKTIKTELRRTPGVLDVVSITDPPGTGNMVNLMRIESESGTMEPTGTDRIVAGVNVVDALKLTVVEGRALSEDIPTDIQQSVLVNESFVKKLGWTKPLGKRVGFAGPGGPGAQVVGVVKDFHYSSLHNAIGPLLIQPLNEDFSKVPEFAKDIVRANLIAVLSGSDVYGTIERIHSLLLKFAPNYLFEPKFLDDRLDELYKSETNLMKLIGIFAVICIFISLIGLFGLTAFTAEQRTKELGIRQVLGASDFDIVALLSRHLLILLLIAAIPASIVSYKAFGQWTQRFAYHIDASWLTCIIATLLVALVTLATVAFQSLKMGLANPVDALRHE
jgi:putative ABC transport system permease protein